MAPNCYSYCAILVQNGGQVVVEVRELFYFALIPPLYVHRRVFGQRTDAKFFIPNCQGREEED